MRGQLAYHNIKKFVLWLENLPVQMEKFAIVRLFFSLENLCFDLEKFHFIWKFYRSHLSNNETLVHPWANA